MTILLALDPGESSGWGLFRYGPTTPLTHLCHGIQKGGVRGFIAWWTDNITAMQWDEVVCESFKLDGRTMFPNVTPLRIEGALEVLWPDTHYQANTYKAAAHDLFLKRSGCWWPGPGHDRDAARHAFAYLRERRHMPTIERYWPRPVRDLAA